MENGASFPDPFCDSSGNCARQDTDDANDNFRLMIVQPSSDTNSARIAQVDNAVRTDEVIHDSSREKNAGHELQDEHGERSAAENIPPAGSVARDRVLDNFANRRCELQATIKPFANLGYEAHGGFFPRRAALAPGVGNSPA